MDQYKYHYARAVRFLARRARSEKEVRDNLQKKQIDTEVLEKVIAKLKEQRFVDDEAFASWWIEQRTRVTPRSMRLIILELLQKGVQKDTIESAIVAIDAHMGRTSTQSDVETAKRIVEKKIRRYESLTREEIYQKLGGYLARKGYSWDVIKKSIDTHMDEH
jgi:regulatory protein